MYFYTIEASISNAEKVFSDKNDREIANEIDFRHKSFYHTRSANDVVFIASLEPGGGEIMLGACMVKPNNLTQHLNDFLKALGLRCDEIEIREITLSRFKSLFDLARLDYFSHNREGDIFSYLDIFPLCGERDIDFKEKMLNENTTKAGLKKKARKLMFEKTLLPEIDRIYMPADSPPEGHPVHYFLHVDDCARAVRLSETLLATLYKNKRTQSRRFSYVYFQESAYCDDRVNHIEIEALYKSSNGGAIVFLMNEFFMDESDSLSGKIREVECVCEMAVKHRNSVLTIIALPRAACNIKSFMREFLEDLTFIELAEDTIDSASAKSFLRQLAKENSVTPDRTLYRNIKEGKTYTPSGLKKEYQQWFNARLKSHYYPQYAEFQSSNNATASRKPKGTAYSELQSLIGLAEAKEVINQSIDYFKAQKLFRERGLSNVRPTMHMVFGGAPGTAKTTVARLFAQVMRDNGVLSIGDLIEVGRADLVGKYVGWTAPEITKKFRQARGSVLFIDEAYSLVDDRDGSYGDEAINTIVAEMENRREDIVVIFAGYSEKMEGFLKKNPGLRSRIAFHVPFPDYSETELYQILELMAENQENELDKGVEEKVLPILSSAMKESDFGNGRFVRNLLEKARMRQSSRLLKMDIDSLSKHDVSTLISEDFAPQAMGFRKERRLIGFSA